MNVAFYPKKHTIVGSSVASFKPLGFVGPLDAYTSGLGEAWSMGRRLLSSYNGALIRVRRSSDNAEQDIGFTSTGLLDGTAFTAFVGGGTAYVVKAYDQTGHGYDRTQGTAAAQPTGSLAQDGTFPALTNSGSTSLKTTPINPQLIMGTNSGLLIARIKPTGGDGKLIESNTDGNLNVWAPNSGTLYFDYGGFSSGRNSVAIPSGWNNNWHWLRCERHAGTQKIAVDQSVLVTTSLSTSLKATPQTIGLPYTFNGQVRESVCWTDGSNAAAKEAALIA